MLRRKCERYLQDWPSERLYLSRRQNRFLILDRLGSNRASPLILNRDHILRTSPFLLDWRDCSGRILGCVEVLEEGRWIE